MNLLGRTERKQRYFTNGSELAIAGEGKPSDSCEQPASLGRIEVVRFSAVPNCDEVSGSIVD